MEELKVYRRKGAGAAAASAEAYQNKCDLECFNLVNNREWTTPPMAAMEYTVPVRTYKKKHLTLSNVCMAGVLVTVGIGIMLALSGQLLAAVACAVAAAGFTAGAVMTE